MTHKIDNNRTDYIVSILKGAAGLIPIGGSFISELIGNIIPNQRIDRITTYCKHLEEKLNQIPTNTLQQLATNPHVVDLLEEGFIQANRAITEERKIYIANLIANGIAEEEVEVIKLNIASHFYNK